MDTRQIIKENSVLALKAGDKKLVSVLRYLTSLIDKKELSLPAGSVVTEEMVMEVLRKELKNKKESRAMFEKGGRGDLVAEVDSEIEILFAYLPAEISQEEIRKEVVRVIEEKGVVFGEIMKQVMAKFKGGVEGGVVSAIVNEEIAKVNG